MDLLTYPGRALYALVTAIALVGGLAVSAFLLLGSSFGSITGGYVAAFILGNLATLGIALGLIWSFSKNKVIVVVTFLSAGFLPCQTVIYLLTLLGRKDLASIGRTPYAYYSLLFIDVLLMILAYSKFIQLRKDEMRGSLHYATDGEAVRRFGRDGGF
jgi:hypothetical protein